MKKFIKNNWGKILIIILIIIVGATFFLLRDKRIEITKHPEYIYSEDFHPDKITVYGIGMGDKINDDTKKMLENEGVAYKTLDGKVNEFILRPSMVEKYILLKKFSYQYADEELIIKFGEPDKIERRGLAAPTKEYFYMDKGLILSVKIYEQNSIWGIEKEGEVTIRIIRK